jgi:exodeoxyribonuclease V gamma subunit
MFVHRSSNLEELVDHLHRVVKAKGLGLLEPETIVIQSAGMERYLSRELSRRSGISANVQFPFPRAFFLRVLDAALGEDPRAAAFERQNLTWILYGQLGRYVRSGQRAFSEVANYLKDDIDQSKRLLLAERLAHLFDQYVTYRPKMVLGWQAGEDAENFQAILWRELCAELGSAHFAARCHRFMNDLSEQELKEALPSRLSLMGGPGLPPLFLQMFGRISRVIPCHLFSFSVCGEYFADAHPLGDPLPDVGVGLHPLLISMGRVGADYQHLLEMIGGYQEGEARFVPPPSASVLGVLQRSLMDGHAEFQWTEEERARVLSGLADDTSITVDSCHSPLREVEVLHDRLLSWFEADPTLRPEDVVVLAPEIETYSPLISAVFSARAGEEPKIPFRIADRSEKFTNPAARALLLSFTVLRGRFKASEVLDLLQLGPVRSRYEIESADLERLARWVSEAGIRWGADGQHKAEFGVPADDLNSWRFGLRRLLLGFALPDDGRQLWEEIVPFDAVAVGDLELVGKLCTFCEKLFSLRQRLSQAGPAGLSPSGWGLFLTDLIDAALGEPLPGGDSVEETWDTGAVRTVVGELVERAQESFSLVESAREEERFGARALYHLLSAELENRRPSTDFLAGGVTFCALLPLRTIPFRAVCVLGLNQGDFPRTDRHHQLDLMARDPKRGDRSLRADDRYLFLEVLLAARERLALSYVGRSVQDNTRIPPSVVVTELSSVLFGLLKQEPEALPFLTPTEHPLQPFHPEYFSDQREKRGRRELVSLDPEMYRAALALRGEQKDPVPFFARLETVKPSEGETEITLDQLVRFWKGPTHAFFEARGVRIADELEEVEDREPVVETGLERYIVGDRLLSQRFRGEPLRQDIELRRGALPVGAGGRVLLQNVAQASNEIFNVASVYQQERVREPRTLTLVWEQMLLDPCLGARLERPLSRIVLTGALDQIFGRVRLETSYGQLNTSRKMGLWLRHLAACAAGLEISHSVLVVRGGPRSPEGVEKFVLAALEPAQAKSLLGTLCGLSVLGRLTPLRFFPEASEKYFECLTNPPSKLGEDETVPFALEEARKVLLPSRMSPRPDTILHELYRGADPLGVLDGEMRPLVSESELSELPFARLAETFFAPLLRAVQSAGEVIGEAH